MAFISVVSPVYKAENIVDELVKQLISELKKITSDYEIILIEDGSPDNSWGKIEENCKQNNKVKGIKLSRNFGQHHAISAGLDHASGKWIIVMDCDLQDRPDQISVLFNKAQEGFDIVFGRRVIRKDSILKKLSSFLFHKTLSYLTGTNIDRTIANYGIYSNKSIQAVKEMRENIRYFPTMIRWVGFKTTAVEIEHGERMEGSSSYNFLRLLRLSFDIMLANSDKPLRLIVKAGLMVSLFSILFGFFIFIRWLTVGFDVVGYASLILSIWLIGGIIISILGVIGLYVGKIFEGVKKRPIYFVDEKTNF